jgi:hypothetical protein
MFIFVRQKQIIMIIATFTNGQKNSEVSQINATDFKVTYNSLIAKNQVYYYTDLNKAVAFAEQIVK